MGKALTLVSMCLPSASLLFLYFFIVSYHSHLHMQVHRTKTLLSGSVLPTGQRINILWGIPSGKLRHKGQALIVFEKKTYSFFSSVFPSFTWSVSTIRRGKDSQSEIRLLQAASELLLKTFPHAPCHPLLETRACSAVKCLHKHWSLRSAEIQDPLQVYTECRIRGTLTLKQV